MSSESSAEAAMGESKKSTGGGMTSEARLKELARMLANHPFLALAVDEINDLEEENAELKERLAECTDRRARLAKALGIDELLPWEDVKLEISKWEELEAENAELRIQLRDESYLADELEASLKLQRERVAELESQEE